MFYVSDVPDGKFDYTETIKLCGTVSYCLKFTGRLFLCYALACNENMTTTLPVSRTEIFVTF